MDAAKPDRVKPDQVLDATGLMCPEPVFEARCRLDAMRPGEVLEIRADDPLAELDLRVFCERTGHGLIESRVEPSHRVLLIRRRERDSGAGAG
jgi:tRNA 2-thiouridine synthesizing protein A